MFRGYCHQRGACICRISRIVWPSSSAASPNSEISFDLTGKAGRLAVLEARQAEPGFWSNAESARTAVQEVKQLKGWVTPYESLRERLQGALELAELVEHEPDAGMTAELEQETAQLAQAVEAFELQAMLQGPEDEKDALLTIHPGAGGTESQDWAEMLMRMYVRWAERHGFDVSILDLVPGEEAGIKSVSIEIKGRYAYGYLKAEKGVHRLVRISPYDSQARRHTSFASVFVYPEVDDTIEIDLRDEDIKMDVFRASGAGGQHVLGRRRLRRGDRPIPHCIAALSGLERGILGIGSGVFGDRRRGGSSAGMRRGVARPDTQRVDSTSPGMDAGAGSAVRDSKAGRPSFARSELASTGDSS